MSDEDVETSPPKRPTFQAAAEHMVALVGNSFPHEGGEGRRRREEKRVAKANGKTPPRRSNSRRCAGPNCRFLVQSDPDFHGLFLSKSL